MHLLHIVKAVNPLVAPLQNNCHLNYILRPHPTGNQWGKKLEISVNLPTNSQVIVCALTCVSYSNSELTADMLHKVRMKKISDVPVPVVTSLSSAELRESASLLLHWSTHKINSRGHKHRKTLKPTRTHHAPQMTPKFQQKLLQQHVKVKKNTTVLLHGVVLAVTAVIKQQFENQW